MTMNRFRLSWQPRPKSKIHKTQFVPLDAYTYYNSALPTLPREVWRKIIAFTVRLAGSNAIELDDPFSLPHQNEEYPEIEPGLFEDRKSLMLVSSQWRHNVSEICCEYLTIYTEEELKFLVKIFEHSRAHHQTGKRLGDWTLRIDFKILGRYRVEHIVRLLQCTPNLLIYNNRNGPANLPERYTPREVLDALVTHCAHSLRRVEWSGAGEAPRFHDLAEFCNKLPHLITLRLVAIHSFPLPPEQSDCIPPEITLPQLKTLSLGTIPRQNDYRPEFAQTWDLFVYYLSIRTQQLPVLERFDCEIFPLFAMNFFHVHGHKLRLFRTASSSADNALPEALRLCPNLQSLVLAQGSETVELPEFHPALRKICIVPTIDVVVGMPQRVFHYAVVRPLDLLIKSIEQMVAPCLSELRVWNLGAYSEISDYGLWLDLWWRRWNIRGVHFCDKRGRPYQDVRDPTDALLDLVRG